MHCHAFLCNCFMSIRLNSKLTTDDYAPSPCRSFEFKQFYGQEAPFRINIVNVLYSPFSHCLVFLLFPFPFILIPPCYSFPLLILLRVSLFSVNLISVLRSSFLFSLFTFIVFLLFLSSHCFSRCPSFLFFINNYTQFHITVSLRFTELCSVRAHACRYELTYGLYWFLPELVA
jgi:hypothetical protein